MLKNKTCQYCNKIFAKPIIMKRHLNICKQKPLELNELKHTILQMQMLINNQNIKINNLQNKLNI